MKHLRSTIIIGYFLILLLLAPINLLSFDTYYYWDWSRHLALSYYDGSPMIAYFIRLSTFLFGDTLFALSLVGIVSTALTSWVIYKTARLFLSKDASYIAMSLWLFAPLMTLDILKQTTYDTPLTLFWALTIYYAAKFITYDKIKDLYLVGACIGLLMLSKYSGVVLVLPLLLFLLTPHYRYLFKTLHFYVVLLLALIIFSPVILWNEQHGWQSFLYQLTTHKMETPANPLYSVIKSFFVIFLPSLNFMFIPPLLCWIKQTNYFSFKAQDKDTRKKAIVNLCRLISTFFLCFYLFVASQATIKMCWLSSYLITSALLGGYCYQTFHYRKSTYLLLAAYGIASVGIVVNNAFPLFNTPQKSIYHYLVQSLDTTYSQLPSTIITSGWFEARMLFFLKNKPQVYTLDCGSLQNQYALWSTDIVQKIKNKTIKEVLYIDISNRISCVAKYFDHCVNLHPPTYPYKNKNNEIYAYICTNAARK
jgi:4-amino-4-deoxy-L-arabinose transferase-like glycosyltransferase